LNSFKKKIYFHRDKEDNWELVTQAEELNFKGTKELSYLGYEIEFEVEIFEDGSNRVLAIDGKDVAGLDLSI
jgi:hypothetical protein